MATTITTIESSLQGKKKLFPPRRKFDQWGAEDMVQEPQPAGDKTPWPLELGVNEARAGVVPTKERGGGTRTGFEPSLLVVTLLHSWVTLDKTLCLSGRRSLDVGGLESSGEIS